MLTVTKKKIELLYTVIKKMMSLNELEGFDRYSEQIGYLNSILGYYLDIYKELGGKSNTEKYERIVNNGN